jgi:glucose/arabinose dehydrogenase
VTEPDRKDVVAKFDVHSCNCGFAWLPSSWGKHSGKIAIAQLGSFAPATDPLSVANPGCRVILVDEAGRSEVLVQNSSNGPASRAGALGRGLERPVDVKVGPDGALYVVDYGVISIKIDRMTGLSATVRDGTGMIWRVSPGGTHATAMTTGTTAQ